MLLGMVLIYFEGLKTVRMKFRWCLPFFFSIPIYNYQHFRTGNLESTTAFGSFLRKVTHSTLMFLNLNQSKSLIISRFVQIFVGRIVCNLFGQISVHLFTLLPNVEDCSDEIYLRSTALGFLFQQVIINSSRLQTLIQPILLEFF